MAVRSKKRAAAAVAAIKLNPQASAAVRREKFVAAYLETPNATRAAIFAGYSPKTAHSQGSRLLKDVKVRAALDAAQRAVVEPLIDRYQITTERTQRELALLGYSNMADYIAIDGGQPVLDFSELTRDQAAAITSIKTKRTIHRSREGFETEHITTEFKLSDKRAALRDLGTTQGLFKDTDEARVPVIFVVDWGSKPPPKYVIDAQAEKVG